MLTHTHRKNMHRLTFVSGDQDFAPLLEAVVRDGMYVELLYPEGHTAPDLMHFADVAKLMDVDFMHSIPTPSFKRENTIPDRCGEGMNVPPDGVLTSEGFLDDAPFAKVWREATGNFIVKAAEADRHNNNTFWTVRDPDEARARRYFARWMERDFGVSIKALKWQARP